MRLHRTPRLGAAAPSSQRVFQMATQGGAQLMRKGAELGRIAPGFRADLVLVDLESITWPWVAPEVDPVELVLLQAGRGDVTHVIVDGELVLENGMPTLFDLKAAGAELAASLASIAYPVEGAQLAAELIPYLEQWYQGWEMPEHKPFVSYNSKV